MVRRALFITLCVTAACACDGHTDNVQEGKGMAIPQANIRKSALAGQWYEGDKERLKLAVSRYMEGAKAVQGLGAIKGLIVPHAGHIYSGPVAGYAYRQVQGASYDAVVVIAPNHIPSGLRFSSVFPHGAYEIPLGLLPVDDTIAKAIADFNGSDDVKASDEGHLTSYGGRMEHSIEIQLPFLRLALGDFKLVPIVMGSQTRSSCEALAKAVAAAVKGKNILLVASSDLSHFHNASTAKKLDSVVSEYVESYDPMGLLDALDSNKCEACGGGPIAAVMMACRELGATKATVVNMATSGDVTGDNSNVVGYLSAVLSNPGGEEKSKVGVDLRLIDREKDGLRDVVKKTLGSVVNGGPIPVFNDKSGKLGEHWGAFVTLTKGGQLRGCIGYPVGTKPLITTVAEMTRAAALEDPRFPRVSPSELPSIDFEISVLTPIRKVSDISEIKVGRDGIIISRGFNRGLLLPQVATEYGWDLETFLENTCLKAGLPRDTWKQKGTVIEAFSAEVFD